MTDDELIVLWSLAGMELWAEFKQSNYNFDKVFICTLQWSSLTFGLVWDVFFLEPMTIFFHDGQFWIGGSNQKFLGVVLYVIDDILSFNPDENWWKLLFAKRWYEKNKELVG